MCGLAGVMGSRCPTDGRDRVQIALAHLEYRGPDGHGVAALRAGWVGATRLALVGDQSEAVPVIVGTDASATVLAFNGEVYLGYGGSSWQQSTGDSDARRLAARIDEQGLAALADLDADFALAWWSDARGELALARDGWGRRPLYYWWRAGLLAFASDLRALALLLGDALPPQDSQRVFTFLRHRAFGPTATALHGVNGVAPGTILRWNADADRPPRQEPLRQGRTRSRPLGDAIAAAARSRLLDPSPSLLISGGVDSTLLVEQLAPEVDDLDLLTWTDGGRSDEVDHAAATARRVGGRLHPVEVNGRSFVAATLALARTTGHPPVDPSEAVIALLAHQAASRTIMMGEGADELFGGYRYLHDQIAALNQRFGEDRASDEAITEVFTSTRSIWSAAEVAHLLGDDHSPVVGPDHDGEAWAELSAGRRRLDLAAGVDTDAEPWVHRAARLTELYLTVHLPDLVLRADRAAMSASREARLPFLADCVTEIVLGASPERFRQLVLGTSDAGRARTAGVAPLGKASLRALVADPRTGVRPKIGFRLPVARWLREERTTVLEVVEAGLGRAGLVDVDRAVAAVAAELADENLRSGVRVFTLLALAATTA